MTEQPEDKVATTSITANSDQAAAQTKVVKGELSEQDLAKVRGGIEQVLNIGSQSSGAGAGKVTFNPF